MSEPIQRFSPTLSPGRYDEPGVDMELDPAGEWMWFTDHRTEVERLQGLLLAQQWTNRIAFALGAGAGAAVMTLVYLAATWL